ncbi:MAG: hypothetical protein O3A36_02060, partial [bacterium]|nr:hypothetical protein [bacterium]
SAYEKAGFPEDHAQLLASLYASKDDNIIYPDGASGYPDCNWKKILIRKISYIAIWIIPLLLLIPGAWQIIRVTATKPTKK